MEFLSSEQFVEDLCAELDREWLVIRIHVFKISAEAIMDRLEPLLLQQLHAGCKVEILADAIFSQYNFSPHIWRFLSSREEFTVHARIQNNTQAMFARLHNAGAEITFINEPGWWNKHFFPSFKRDHRKIIILEGKSGVMQAYYGAVNLDGGGRYDFMIKEEDADTVTKLRGVSGFFGSNLPASDTLYSLRDQKSTLLFDRGRPGSSLIYKTGLSMIQKATNQVLFVSQMPAECSLLTKFIRARRNGAKVTHYMPVKSHPNISSFPNIIMYWIVVMVAKVFSIKIIHLRVFTHAKILIADNEVLIGSHNLSYTGVVSGVAEVSVRSSDDKLVQKVRDFVERFPLE